MERGRDKDIQISYAIELERVSCSVGEKRVLENVNLKLRKGDFYLLVGRNGSGKTTLLKLMAGLIEPDSGKMKIFGKTVENLWELRLNTGYVFQNPVTQIIGSTVEEDLAFGLENMGLDPEEMEKRIDWILKFVELEEYRCTDPMTLSGGQIQRLAIASILILEPEILLLDEPLGMLDNRGKSEVIELMRKMKEKRKTVVLATHDLEGIDFADGIIYTCAGSVEIFEVEDFFSVHHDDVPKPSWF